MKCNNLTFIISAITEYKWLIFNISEFISDYKWLISASPDDDSLTVRAKMFYLLTVNNQVLPDKIQGSFPSL